MAIEPTETTAIPGPWVAETHVCKDQSGDGLAVIAVIPENERDGHMGTPTRGMVAWVHCGLGACDTEDKAIATARQIAAMPDMLALLIESQDNIGGDWRARRDAVITKATGVQK